MAYKSFLREAIFFPLFLLNQISALLPFCLINAIHFMPLELLLVVFALKGILKHFFTFLHVALKIILVLLS